jgi:hypothetical protein
MNCQRQPRVPLAIAAIAGVLLVTGCLSQSPAARPVPTNSPPATRDLVAFCDDYYRANAWAKDVCHNRIAIASRTPGALQDEDIWEYLILDHEEQQWIREEELGTSEAVDRSIDARRAAEVETHEAMVAKTGVAAKATIEADYRNDAVRECIRAGNDETLCLLDPENPMLD